MASMNHDEMFEWFPDDASLMEIRKCAPALYKDLYVIQKHWPVKAMMEMGFGMADSSTFFRPWEIFPFVLGREWLTRKLTGEDQLSSLASVCLTISQTFAWLTHQRVYELSNKYVGRLLELRIPNTLDMKFYRSLPETGLYVAVPHLSQVEKADQIPVGIFASLDCIENRNEIWLVMRLDMREYVKEITLPIAFESANISITLGDCLNKLPEKDRYTFYSSIQLLASLISPRLKLIDAANNLVLLPTNRDIHPKYEESFQWPKRVTFCQAGWRGISHEPSAKEIETIWNE